MVTAATVVETPKIGFNEPKSKILTNVIKIKKSPFTTSNVITVLFMVHTSLPKNHQTYRNVVALTIECLHTETYYWSTNCL